MNNPTTYNSSSCEPDRLAILIDNELSHPDYRNVIEHVENCAACQARLDSLAGDESWWNRASQFLPSDGGDSALDDSSSQIMLIDSTVQARLDTANEGGSTSLPITTPSQSSNLSPEQSLTGVLQPPRHPEMLGRLDKYDIERMIGRGGMGIVFKGFDHELNRPVAIKVMSPHLATSGVARRRFAREARAAAAVVHPQVVPIFGVDASHENPYIVMPFINGSSLQAHIEKNGPLESKELIRVAMHVASGLAAAHAQGLVHRDVKPANILVDQNISRVMITDFGLARAADDDVAMTQTGWLAGTPHYMSPEQATGKSVDGRSDLFSLGSVMYFLATGGMPFRASVPMAVLNKICHEQPQPIRDVNPDIPRRTSEIISRLLEKDPDDRFASARDLHSHLSIYLAHVQQPNIYPAPKRVVSRRRQFKMLWRIAIGVSLVCGVVIAAWLAAGMPGRQSQQTESAVESSADEVLPADMVPPTRESVEQPPAQPVLQPNEPTVLRSDLLHLLPDQEFENQLQSLEAELELLSQEITIRAGAPDQIDSPAPILPLPKKMAAQE